MMKVNSMLWTEYKTLLSLITLQLFGESVERPERWYSQWINLLCKL